jgi:hypothetical protein
MEIPHMLNLPNHIMEVSQPLTNQKRSKLNLMQMKVYKELSRLVAKDLLLP